MLARYRMIIFVLLFFYLFAPFSFAADKATDKSSEGTSQAPAKSEAQLEQKTNPSAKGITDAAVKAGVQACADRIYQVTNYLTTGIKSGAVLFTPPSDPDKRLVSLSLGLETPGGKVAYASESFAPNQANGCGSLYETVVYWDASCTDVAKLQFPGLKNSSAIVNNLIMLEGGASVRIFLMPAGMGCVAIKKEVLN